MNEQSRRPFAFTVAIDPGYTTLSTHTARL